MRGRSGATPFRGLFDAVLRIPIYFLLVDKSASQVDPLKAAPNGDGGF